MMEGMALAQLRPDSLADIPGETGNWQQRKSLATRNAMLEAALHCLAEFGYGGCSLQMVATRAGISRGAMLHHYATKLDLMAAVIEYAFFRRMAQYLDRIRALSEEERQVHNTGVKVSFETSLTPEYQAFLELHMASRTDPELRAIFLTRAALYDRLWRIEIEKVFPEWAGDDRLDRMNDFVRIMVDGLALNVDVWADDARVEAILAFVAKTLSSVRAGHIGI